MSAREGEQRLRRSKRVLLGPWVRPALAWGRRGRPTPARLAALRYVAYTGLAARREDFVATAAPGFRIAGNTSDLIPLMIRLFGVWEPVLTDLVARRLEPGRVFVDVGANRGWFSLCAATAVGPDGAVVAIEASPRMFDELTANVERNAANHVRCVHAAVASRPGRVDVVETSSANSGATRVESSTSGSVPAEPLGSLLTDDETARCRMIKIDVEGAEFDVVQGLPALLPRLPDDVEIVVEVAPDRASGPDDVARLVATFETAGFHPYRLPNDYSMRFYRDPTFPDRLERLRSLPTEECDILFARVDDDHLALR